jgi:hypothetical protein
VKHSVQAFLFLFHCDGQLEETVSQSEALMGPHPSLYGKFLRKKVATAFEFETCPSKIGVFAKERKQEILRSDHANRDNALVRGDYEFFEATQIGIVARR